MSVFEAKSKARDGARTRFAHRGHPQTEAANERIVYFAQQLLDQFKPKHCFMYLPQEHEPDLTPLLDWPEHSCTFASPLVVDKVAKEMCFVQLTTGQALEKGSFGVPVPVSPRIQVVPAEQDIVFVPAMVLDIYGGRLGHGAGFYDRWFALLSVKLRLVGVAFADCVTETPLPIEAHDVKMDIVLSETGFVWV
ncbi:MAG: 5-formyltetrahydrofolate cyclo-ligase [Zetaproteobacteria bacterium]|nr:5-formyltetrahydrofolate cyclo-ligase [Zetaproteobacteria bacterium]